MGNLKSDQKNARKYGIKLSKSTDADIIAKLDRQASVQGYIKDLIRADMKEANTMKYRIIEDKLDTWGADTDTVIDMNEVERLSREWEKPVNELMQDLIPMEYSVSLANRETLFDSADVETLSDVLSYIPGHGGVYVAHITNNRSGETISVSYNDDTETYSRFDGWEWETITERDIRNLIG